jgi:transposase-like protein
MSELNAPHFHDDEAAREHLESVRWPGGPVCPHCGGTEKAYKVKSAKARPGLYKCGHCKKQYTVTVGTVFERSKIPLSKWFQAAYLLCSSKKGISSHQIMRILHVTYQTAWFMTHRLREAMRNGTLPPLGGEGKIVEADETYIGRKKGWKPQRGGAHKMKVLSLVERGGEVRSIRMDTVTAEDVGRVVRENVARESRLMTDEGLYYVAVGKEFAGHEAVKHRVEEWARGEAHVNTLEGYFGVFKRGMKGIYQHCSERHLPRYLAEFDFRYNNRKISDLDRTLAALRGIEGKRLLYRDS